jgi:23S rRNA (adenine2503-C2)-methyltransferase
MSWDNVKVVTDPDSTVSKYIFEKDDAVVESVLYRYPDYATRTVICCSVQSGCPMGCRFCGSGDYFVRSLTADEIVSQSVRCLNDIEQSGTDVQSIERLQIMFMSMGEPALNQKNLVLALRTLHGLYPNAALLVSTSGPKVDYLPLFEVSKEIPNVGLQFSVHESTDAARNALVPFAKKLTLEEMGTLGWMWQGFTGRKPFFNYCAHADNSSPEDADRLAQIFNPHTWNATVSVICERQEWLPATNEHQRNLASNFASELVNRDYDVRMFDPSGQDTVGGGCGQLWYVQDWMRNHPDKARPSAGCGKNVIHTPKLP